MDKKKKFEEACKKIKKRDGVNAMLYTLQGKKADKGVTLKEPYRSIAKKYLYHEHILHSSNSRIFSWKQVTDACVIADIYVTDVIRKQYPEK